MKKLNESQIIQKWRPMLESTTGVKDGGRLAWMSKYAHYHSMNEAATGIPMVGGTGIGASATTYANLGNVQGVGNAIPASMGATTSGQQWSQNAKGSGDKWASLLPLALQVAGKTTGFDVVNVFPLQAATGMVPYFDYVYAGGKNPYGAAPGTHDRENPLGHSSNSSTTTLFKIPVHSAAMTELKKAYALIAESGKALKVTFSKGAVSDTNKGIVCSFIQFARIFGYPMFRVVDANGNAYTDIFDGTTTVMTIDATEVAGAITTHPQSISALEDQIQGYTGAGEKDDAAWSGSYMDPKQIYDPMDRGTGEGHYPRSMMLQAFTKFVTAGTQSVSVMVTQEQIQDWNKQWGIDILAMVETAGVNEISQSINKMILSRLFALGWKNHVEAFDAENINLNMNVKVGAQTVTTYSHAIPDGEKGSVLAEMSVPKMVIYAVDGASGLENQDTIIKRIMANCMAAGNVINQRGRRGPANFIVTNLKIATALQSNASYVASPVENDFKQSSGGFQPMGKIAGMTLFVDPNMKFSDTRVLVGRKGEGDDEPGVIFCPYLLAEKVSLIAEGTAAPKVIIKSRFALVDTGFHPQSMYLTFFVNTNEGATI